MKTIYINFILMVCLSTSIKAALLVVSNTNDSGPGSFREAINGALAAGGNSTIEFNIPLSDAGYSVSDGVWKIIYADNLPSINENNIIINGHSQTTNQGDRNPFGPEICLSGDSNSVETAFFIDNASNIEIRGLIIQEFIYGIQIFGDNASNNLVQGCYIGTNNDGTQRRGNFNGIELLSGAHHNTIGGSSNSEKNIISGNEYAGVRISDSHYNTVLGNFVGVDRNGKNALYNYDGITVEGQSSYNQIGGRNNGEKNICSGNVAYGIDLFGAGVTGNKVQGNYIGTDVDGLYAIPNTYGILFDDRSHLNIVGGHSIGEGNLISGNTAFGAYFYNNGTNTNSLIGNKIGTDKSGMYAIPNEVGAHIDGATFGNIVDSNIISGNKASGINIFGILTDNNIITRNRIGTDISGTIAIPNQKDGIRITQSPKGNLIGGSPQNANWIYFNGKNGISVEGMYTINNTISCNSFFMNQHMGIDIFPEGFNENDPLDVDSGANQLINHPIIDSVIYYDNFTAQIKGHTECLHPELCKVEIYIAHANFALISQGFTYLGTIIPDINGNWSYSNLSAQEGNYYTATITDNSGNTSEFCRAVPEPQVGINSSKKQKPEVFPNPVPIGDPFYIKNANEIEKISLIEMNGSVIKKIEIRNLPNDIIELKPLEIKTGTYLLKIESKDKTERIFIVFI